MAEPVINFNSPLLPGEPALKVTTQEPSVTVKQRTPAADTAIQEFGAANTALSDANAAKTGALAGQANIDETVGAPGALQIEQDRQQRRGLTQTQQGARIGELRSAAAAKRAEMERAGNIEPMLTGWKSVLAGVLQGFAQYSHTRTGAAGMAPGVEAWNSATARDRQMKLDAFKRSADFNELAQNDVKSAEDALRAKLAQIDNDHIAAGNLLARKLEAMKSRFKSQEAIASADATAATIRASQAEKMAKLEGEFAGTVQRHGQTVTTSTPQVGGKTNAASNLAAARSGMILDTVQDAMKEPPMTAAGLQKYNTNKARMAMGQQMPAVAAGVGMLGGNLAPAEGDQAGLTQPDRRALSRQSVLNETVTYLTTGAAATKDEAASKTGQLQILPGDDKTTVHTKLVNTYRYAKSAAQQGAASMTPEHLEKLHELGVALGLEKPAAAPAGAPSPKGTPGTFNGRRAYQTPGGIFDAETGDKLQ